MGEPPNKAPSPSVALNARKKPISRETQRNCDGDGLSHREVLDLSSRKCNGDILRQKQTCTRREFGSNFRVEFNQSQFVSVFEAIQKTTTQGKPLLKRRLASCTNLWLTHSRICEAGEHQKIGDGKSGSQPSRHRRYFIHSGRVLDFENLCLIRTPALNNGSRKKRMAALMRLATHPDS